MNGLLLDTHVLLWVFEGEERLSTKVRKALKDPGSRIFVSAASLWELAIKSRLGKLELPRGLDGMIQDLAAAGIHELPVSWGHTLAVNSLPLHHRDPFDRLLVAQAQSEGMTLVSADKAFGRYQVSLLW